MDPTERFSSRAEVYALARPSYPADVFQILREHHGLHAGAAVADLGSGTGIFTRLLLESGARVHAVEPNDDMRAKAELLLGHEPGFSSIAGRAEATSLPDASVELVTAAQAFHWFDLDLARREIVRICARRAMPRSCGTNATSARRPFFASTRTFSGSTARVTSSSREGRIRPRSSTLSSVTAGGRATPHRTRSTSIASGSSTA